MSTQLYRVEPGRYLVADVCRGLGSIAGTGESFTFRGIDASLHGFGCVFSKFVAKGSVVSLQLGHYRISFDVMWCESHLGIDNMYRVGLTSCDPHLNVEAVLEKLGYLETLAKQAS